MNKLSCAAERGAEDVKRKNWMVHRHSSLSTKYILSNVSIFNGIGSSTIPEYPESAKLPKAFPSVDNAVGG